MKRLFDGMNPLKIVLLYGEHASKVASKYVFIFVNGNPPSRVGHMVQLCAAWPALRCHGPRSPTITLALKDLTLYFE